MMDEQEERQPYPCECGADCQFMIDTGVSKMCTWGEGCVIERADHDRWIQWPEDKE